MFNIERQNMSADDLRLSGVGADGIRLGFTGAFILTLSLGMF